MQRRLLGEDHPDTLTSMNNLAVSLWNLGERKDAIALMTLATTGETDNAPSDGDATS